MEMLLRRVPHAALAGMFRRHADRSSAGHLRNADAIAHARSLARNNGVWDAISTMDPTADIPVVKRSAYRNFARSGNRTVPEAAAERLASELERATLAVWLEHPHADVDYLQDLLWAACDEWTWIMAAHEGRAIDLASAERAAEYAEILYALGDRMEEEVTTRVREEIDRRVLRPFWEYGSTEEWKTSEHNWNHVCNGSIIRAALLLIDDPDVLAHTIHGAITNMTYAIDGFTDDGGCVEGPGYWNYGFGHYLQAAFALRERTGGELDIMADEKLERICRYPLAAHLEGPLRATFADSAHGYTEALPALLVNRFYETPELLGLCELLPDLTLRVHGMHELALYDGRPVEPTADPSDYYLPDLGLVKLRGHPGPRQLTLLAVAGNNGVNHSHNDIGSFVVHREGRLHLVDPGGPVYSAKTFSARRYEIVYCNSYGHSVPVINGRPQSAGSEFYGTLAVENLNGSGDKRAVIDLANAYPSGTVGRLVRTIILHARENTLELVDEYSFARAPESVEESFITFEEATVEPDGRSVQVGPEARGVRITARAPGRFTVAHLEEESKEGRSDQGIVRIGFVPETTAKDMELGFAIG